MGSILHKLLATYDQQELLSSGTSSSSLDLVSWADDPQHFGNSFSFPAAAYADPWTSAGAPLCDIFAALRYSRLSRRCLCQVLKWPCAAEGMPQAAHASPEMHENPVYGTEDSDPVISLPDRLQRSSPRRLSSHRAQVPHVQGPPGLTPPGKLLCPTCE